MAQRESRPYSREWEYLLLLVIRRRSHLSLRRAGIQGRSFTYEYRGLSGHGGLYTVYDLVCYIKGLVMFQIRVSYSPKNMDR